MMCPSSLVLINNIHCPEILANISCSITIFLTDQKSPFMSQSYTYNKPKSQILQLCNNLIDFDFKSKLWNLNFNF